MTKKDLLARLGYRASNAARDIFTPLQEGGFIDANRVTVTLIKADDFDV